MINLKALLLVVFILGNSATFIEAQDESETSLTTSIKLPLYVGRGYHILHGNPKSEKGLDPGFYHPIFYFTYSKNETTSDNKYLIPDQVTAHKMATCSLSTTVNSFRGTKSYEEDLQTIAKVSAGSKLFGFKFSMSTSYQRMQNKTSEHKEEVIHSEASCESYEILMNKYALPKLSDQFVKGALSAFEKKNWTDFVSVYGTHYADEAIMGGRAIQETTYSYDSVSKMESLNIDIQITAKASFAKFYADSSFDFHKYQKEIEYSEKIESSKTQFYVGGQPPRDGNIHEWQTKIIENPMPISYKLTPLTDLFEHITDSKFNKTEAVNQFNKELDNECAILHCKAPSDDFPKPPPAHNQIEKTQSFGTTNSQAFEEYFDSTTMELRKVNVRSGQELDNLQLFISDGISEKLTAAVGGSGGSPHTWAVPDEEHVTQLEIRSGARIDAITFVTNKGTKSPTFGGGGGSYHMLNIPDGFRIIGFYGKQGGRVDQLGFVVAKTIYPPLPSGQNVEIQKLQIE